MNIKKYLKIWIKTSLLSLQSQIMNKGASIIYITGKFVRFGLFFIVLRVIVGDQRQIGGYNLNQMINFFLVFNLFDILGQLFFRGIYWFRHKVISGRLDLSLLKPINIIFQILTDRTDLLDLPLLLVVLWMLNRQGVFSTGNNGSFFILTLAAFMLITATHILIACVGIITTEVDHTAWIFRDLSFLARVPVDIYAGWLRTILVFIIPVGIIFTMPAKALMGFLSWPWVLYSLVAAILFLIGSIKVWNWSVKHYSSASS